MRSISDEIIFGGTLNQIKIWNIQFGNCLNTLVGHESFVMDIIKLTNEHVASCDSAGKVLIWKNEGECLRTIDARSGIIISYLAKLSDNKIIICGSDQERNN